jgi:DNA-binding SARP family transcriptional activator/tetratricopeptide (TPR) repeat protein
MVSQRETDRGVPERQEIIVALYLQLLGPPQVWCGEQLLSFKTRKALAVLAYLATVGGLHRREHLATLLWPENDAEDARGNLRSALAHLRQALGAAETVLAVTRETIGLCPGAPLTLDVQTLARAQRLVGTGAGAPAPRAELERAVAAYRGPFLDGMSLPHAPEFESWIAGQRAHWLSVVGEVLDRLAALQAEDGDLGMAVGTLERWVALDPGEEGAWQRLIATHLERGDLGAARRAWAACRAALARLGLEPSGATAALPARVTALTSPGIAVRGSAPDPLRATLTETPLVDRVHEVARLRQAFARAQAGQAQVVILEGEAGIGKTRLAGVLLAWAHEQGADVLSGRALEAAGRLPYAPLVEALRARLERENAPEDLLEDVWLAELARLLPELRTRYPDLPSATDDPTLGHGRLFEAVARLGVALAERAPLVLLVDDLQSADLATRDLLRYLARRWAEDGVRALIVLAVRAEDVGTERALAQWLGRLERDAPTTRLAVEVLASDDVQQWVALLAGDAQRERVPPFGAWLARQTAGHPFYMVQTMWALLSQGVLGLRAAEGEGWDLDLARTEQVEQLEGLLPAGVRALIRERLDRLDEVAAEVLVAGAVLGSRFSAEHAYRVAAVEERAGLRALDALVRGRLLREMEEGGYAFTHDLIQATVYQEAGEARRRLYHRRVLAVLEAEGAPAAELARHALAARLLAPAVRHSVVAGEAALEVLAVRDALAHFERARRLVAVAGPDHVGAAVAEDLARLYLHLGRAYELAQDPAQAGAAYRALRALAQQWCLPRAKIGALSHLAMLAARAGDRATARTLLEEALGVAEASGDRPALVEIETHLADIAQSDPVAAPEALQRGEHALALARELGQPHLVAASLHALSYVAATMGDYERTAALAEEAGALYAVLDTQPPEFLAAPRTITGTPPSSRLQRRAMQADCLHQLSCARTLIGEPRAALEAARAALAIRQAQTEAEDYAMTVVFGYNQGQFSLGLVYALVELGAYAEALHVAEHGVARLRVLDVPFVLLWVLDALAWAHLALQQGDAARQVGEEMLRLSQRLPLPLFIYQPNARLCAACVLTGDWACAHTYALRATEARIALALADLTHADLTVALLWGGDVALAREGVGRFGAVIGANRRFRIPYLRALATLAQWEGAMAQAIAHLEEAQALAAQIGLPGEQWQLAALLAQTYRDQGQVAQAERAQARAEATLQALAEGLPDPTLRASFLVAAERTRRGCLRGAARSATAPDPGHGAVGPCLREHS